MPGFPFPGRPGGEHDEPLLDMIIGRRVLPPDAPQPMHDLARMLAALAGPAESGELAGEAAVRAAFSRAASPAGISVAARRPGRRRRARRLVRSRARLATALVAVAGLGSVFAAYIDVLPSPIQQLAHVTVAAPAPHSYGSRHTEAARKPSATRGSDQQSGSRPSARPPHSAGPARLPGQPTASPGYTPSSAGSPGHPVTGPSCRPALGRSPSPQPKVSGHPSPPAWSQPVHCTGIPTGPSSVPTLNPYPHLSDIPSD